MPLLDSLRRLRLRFVTLLHRDRFTAELEEEMRWHMHLRGERLEADGWSHTDAAAEARRRFGRSIAIAERAREAWGARVLDVATQDVRYALRGLVRTPGVSAMIVVTLALGLGVSAAVLSLLDRLFVRPPAGVVAPNEVRRLYLTHDWGTKNAVTDEFNYPQLLDLRSATDPATPIAVYATDTVVVGSDDAPRRVVGYTDASFWHLLGVHASRGRTFDASEVSFASPADVAVISDSYWRATFGGRDNALGSTVQVAGTRYTIVGIAPAGFAGVDLNAVDLWLPLGAVPVPHFSERPWYMVRSSPMLQVLVRAARPERLGRAEAAWSAAYRAGSVAAQYTSDSSAVISTGPVLAALGPGKANLQMLISTRLAWVSLLVLLIACTNVANLLVARSHERRREIAIRLAMGISARRLAFQMLVESVLFASIASAAALVAGAWSGAALRRLLLPEVRWGNGLLDPRLAVATAVIAVVVAIAICAGPLIQARKIEMSEALKGSGGSARSARGRNGFVVAQTAFATVLLCGAALFVQSLRRIATIDLGYDVSAVLTAFPYFTDARGGEDDARIRELSTRLPEVAARLERAPGVTGVALASHGPMRGFMMTSIRIPGGPDSTPTLNDQQPSLTGVSPSYWNVVGLHAVRGRLLNDEDRVGTPPAIVVNQAMAQALWPGRNPLAQCVYPWGKDDSCYDVVGVVSDAHRASIFDKPTMQAFISTNQVSAKGRRVRPWSLVVRTSPDRIGATTTTMRRTFRESLPGVEPNIESLGGIVASEVRPWRLGAMLFSALGALALAVAAVGVYSVLAYSVSRRTREIGVRMALGAHRARVMRLITTEGLRTVVVGVALGVAITLVSAPLVASMLYGTSAHDPAALSTMAGVMLIVAIIASIVPAWRAGRVDPAVAMRAD